METTTTTTPPTTQLTRKSMLQIVDVRVFSMTDFFTLRTTIFVLGCANGVNMWMFANCNWYPRRKIKETSTKYMYYLYERDEHFSQKKDSEKEQIVRSCIIVSLSLSISLWFHWILHIDSEKSIGLGWLFALVCIDDASKWNLKTISMNHKPLILWIKPNRSCVIDFIKVKISLAQNVCHINYL